MQLMVGLVMRSAGALSAFAMTIVVARWYGAQTFGQFQMALATSTILSTLSLQGLDRLIVRAASTAFAQDKDALAYNFFILARNRQLLVSLPLALLIVVLAEPFAQTVLGEPSIGPHLRLMAPAIVGLTFIKSASSLIRAKGQIFISQLLDGVSYTTIAILIVALMTFGLHEPPPIAPSLAYLCGFTTISIVALWRTQRMIASTPREKQHEPLAAGLYIAGFAVLAAFTNWLGLALLTGLRDSAEAGIYRAGFQVCLLFTLVNGSFAIMSGPRLATSFDRKDAAEVWRTVRLTSVLGTAIVMPLLLAVIFGAEIILGFFGAEFVSGATALRILAIGQFVNVAAGSAGAALTMMKRERMVLVIEIVATIVSVAIMLWFLPTYGMVAAAVASAVAAVLRNVGALLALYRFLAELRKLPA